MTNLQNIKKFIKFKINIPKLPS